jgi:hypothetical protein
VSTTDPKEDSPEPRVKAKSVAAAVLGEFFDALEREEDLVQVSRRLRKVVVEDGVFAQPSIHAALFPDTS